jgi:PAS domain-containing protein
VSLPLVVGGRVVFLPQDRSDPVILDRRTGREAPLPPLSTPVAWWRTQHLAGAWGTGFAAAGSPGVAVDTADGRVVELPASDGGRLWRGAAAGGRMYLPGAKALATYDMSTWALIDSTPWPFSGEAGNLVVAGDLCLTLSDRLAVATGAAALEDRFRSRTESSPPDADACLRAAMILERSGRPLEAAAHYRRALFAMEGDPSRSAAIGEIRERMKEACGY